jgi:hypothetical protein
MSKNAFRICYAGLPAGPSSLHEEKIPPTNTKATMIAFPDKKIHLFIFNYF